MGAPDIVALPQTGGSRLLDIAAPLLQLLGRLRNTYSQPDPVALRLRTVQAVRDFDAAAATHAIPAQIAHRARYALCASIDDIAMNTPWGKASKWVDTSLVAMFHQEVIAGEGFFDQLERLKREPANNLALLELMYYCLALGYEGQYRLFDRGRDGLERIRSDLYATILRLRQPYDRDLSPRWRGADAPYLVERGVVPIWVMAAASLGVLALAYFIFSRQLSADTDRYMDRGEIPPLHMPVIAPPPVFVATPTPTPPEPSPLHVKLTDPELQFVTDTPQRAEMRIFSGGMFDSGDATVHDRFVPLLMKIGDALNDAPGKVLITGHTDDQRMIDTRRFESNYDLSKARAEAAAAIIRQRLRDPSRVTVEGRANMAPIDPSPTEAARRQNRRIEIILIRQD